MFVNFLCRGENSFDREKKKTQRTAKKGPSRNSEFDKSVFCIVSSRASPVVMHVHTAFNWYLHVFIYLQARFNNPTQLQKSTYKGFLKLFPVRFEILVIKTFEVKKLNIHFNWAPGSPCVYETQALM